MEQTRILKKDVSFTEAIEELYNGTCDRLYYWESSKRQDYLHLDESEHLRLRELDVFTMSRDWYNKKFDTAKILSDKDIIEELTSKLLVSKITNFLLVNKTVGEKFYLDKVRYMITGLNLPCPFANSINITLDDNVYCVEVIKEEYNHA